MTLGASSLGPYRGVESRNMLREIRSGAVLATLAVLVSTCRVSSAACPPTNPDIAIYGVELGDPLSAALQLGSGYELVEDESGLPLAVFTNAAESEVLKLYKHHGDKSGSFREAEVLATGDLESDVDATVLDTPHFRTGRGVKLGLSRKEVLDRFGPCAATGSTESGADVIRYEITDITTSDLLKAQNMPLYYAEYAFEQDKLVRFVFGFSYP